MTINNATTGLMLALKLAADRGGKGRYIFMPSFMFAAAAHAVLWAGLTPLLVDSDCRSCRSIFLLVPLVWKTGLLDRADPTSFACRNGLLRLEERTGHC